MSRKLFVAALAAAALAAPSSGRAGEGMWTPDELSTIEAELSAHGLSAAELSDLDKGPLAAVVNLNGCTASFVSPEGLVVTNHHCAVGALQYISAEGEDRHEHGYTAKSRAEELWAGPAARVSVTVSQEDVTARFEEATRDLADDVAVFRAIDRLEKELVATCEASGEVRCDVASYDGGARRLLIRRVELRDVRLVHAPPRAIGNYGDDIDNWMWPRHTGDWSLFRAYVGPDGKPAEHADSNVPYAPARWLAIGDGVAAGDTVVVAGYPGRTYRYRPASEVAEMATDNYPWLIGLLDELLRTVDVEQKRAPEAAVKLTSLNAGLSNYRKYLQGILDGFRQSGVVEARTEQDKALRAFIAEDEGREAKWGAHLDAIAAIAAKDAERRRADQLLGWLFRLPASLRTAGALHWLAVERGKPDAERQEGFQERDWPDQSGAIEQAMRAHVPSADRALTALLLREAAALPGGSRLPALDAWLARFAKNGDRTPPLGGGVTEGAVDRAVAWLYEKPTKLADPAVRKALFEADRATVEKSEHRLIQLAAALWPDRDELRRRTEAQEGARARSWPGAMAARRAHSDRPLYADANSTLRITFGRVEGYSPREAVEYAPFTTLTGVLEKDTGAVPFDLPKVVRDAIERTQADVAAGKPGPWVVPSLGSVPVDFLSTLDTTGGNSGSPTLDKDGRLVGLLFDGNYESMASDWVFDTKRTRSIHVDIRYMLWALREAFGGEHLLVEMGVAPRS
jgi:hypothetical protein